MKEETSMDKITTAMAEHVCDKLCRFLREIEDEEELADTCASCDMGQYVCNILNEYNGSFEELKRSHKNAQELAGELLREKDKQQWIPVEERLPEVGTQVLGSGGILEETVFVTTLRDFDGKQYFDIKTTVNAWMPLPELYKQVNRNLEKGSV